MFRGMLKMMSSKIYKKQHESDTAVAHKIATFLADYAALLYGCGATCIRTEKNTRRMAEAFGMECDISIMPTHIYISVWRKQPADTGMAIRKTIGCGINFNLNARLSRLSWEVADKQLDFATAVERLERIRETKPTGKYEVLLLTSLANASFCRLFGGDWIAMLIVFLSTLAGYKVKQIMLEDKRDVRLTFLCASFFSSALSAGGHIFQIGTTPEVALGTSVLYLIPGVPYINAISDMLDRHYLCAFSRFMDAAVLTACLSVGLCAGMFLLELK